MDKPLPFIADKSAQQAAEQLRRNNFGHEEADEVKRSEAMDRVAAHMNVPYVRSALANFAGITRLHKLSDNKTVINPMFHQVVAFSHIITEAFDYLTSRIDQNTNRYNPSVNRALCMLAGIEYQQLPTQQ